MSADDGPRSGREIAYRLFAAEYDDASISYAESDEERAPNYVIVPTGARVNRLFAVGTVTEVTRVNDEMLRARVVDPTGAFVVYAGQYQPDERAFLERVEPPAFVAVTGKARTFQPEDSERVYTSIRPESIATVDAATRDRWVVTTAEHTLERIGAYAAAADGEVGADRLPDALEEAGLESGLAEGIPLAMEGYGTTATYLAALRDLATDAVSVVAGERDEVAGIGVDPGDERPDGPTFAALAAASDLSLEEDAAGRSVGGGAEGTPVEGGESAAGARDDEREVATGSDGSEAATGDAVGAGADGESGDATGADAMEIESELEYDETGEEPDETAEDGEPTSDSPSTAEETVAANGASPPGDDGDLGDDDLGDFESSGLDDGMYEMDDEERERLEEEYGAEFSTGTEVDDPGEADVDEGAGADPETDDGDAIEPAGGGDESAGDGTEADETVEAVETDEVDDSLEAAETDETGETDADEDDAAEGGAAEDDADDGGADGSAPADVDLESHVVDRMRELDDGDGADREELVEAVVEETNAGRDEVEDAIQDALMGGQCYEPDDETLKPI